MYLTISMVIIIALALGVIWCVWRCKKRNRNNQLLPLQHHLHASDDDVSQQQHEETPMSTLGKPRKYVPYKEACEVHI